MINIFDESGALDAAALEWIRAAAATAFVMHNKEGGLDILAVEPEQIRTLNREHRGVDRVTDVLSFPSAESGEIPPDGFWGDIVLCPLRAKEQAAEYGHGLHRELSFLTIHGMLHLFGYDHIQPAEEERMLFEQRRILERMGLSR